jgi:cytochrome b
MTDRNKSKDRGLSRWASVWDLPTRLFHWLLVLTVAIGALTGFFGPEWMLGLHVWSGYGLGGLILFRVVWGFFGGEYSRIASFAFPPRAAIRHLRDLAAGRAAHSIGHNPAGAAMIFALIGTLTGILAAGLITLGGQEKQGVLAGLVRYELGHAARELHEILTILLLVRPLAAMAALAVTGIVLGKAIGALASLPPLGLYPLVANSAYDKECGACHYDFHPSLLPAASWATMMAGLDDHFGENASLGYKARDEIAAWLAANAGERWDTEAANRFRKISPDQPLRVTGIRYWKRRPAPAASTTNPSTFPRRNHDQDYIGGTCRLRSAAGRTGGGRHPPRLDPCRIPCPGEKRRFRLHRLLGDARRDPLPHDPYRRQAGYASLHDLS